MSSRDLTQGLSEQIGDLIERLSASFVDELDGVGSESGARILQLFDVWRQVSLRRIVDLAESAETFFLQGRLLPGCTLTRSAVETVAVQYTVWKKLGGLLTTEDTPGIHSLLMSAVFGRRDKGDSWPNKSLQVLTAVGHLDKQFPGFRDGYDRLSEFVHPGLAGGYGMYVRREGDDLRSYFGQNPLGLEMGPWGQSELGCALQVAVHFHELLREMRSKVAIVVKAHDQNGCS